MTNDVTTNSNDSICSAGERRTRLRRAPAAFFVALIAICALWGATAPTPAQALEPADGGFNQRRFRVVSGASVDVAVPVPWGPGPIMPLCLVDSYTAEFDDDMGWFCTWRYDARQEAVVFTISAFGAESRVGRGVAGTATLVNASVAKVTFVPYDTAAGDTPDAAGVVKKVDAGRNERLLNMVTIYDPRGNNDFGFRFGRSDDGAMAVRVGPADGSTERAGRLGGAIVRIESDSATRLSGALRDFDGRTVRQTTHLRSSADHATLCLVALEGRSSTAQRLRDVDDDFSVRVRPSTFSCAQLDGQGRRRMSKDAPIALEFWSDDGNRYSVADVAIIVLHRS